MSTKVCLISTVNHNVGDDFVREGIVWLLEKVLGKIEPRIVHKHFPATVRGGWAHRLDEWTRVFSERTSLRLMLSTMAGAPPWDAWTDGVLSSDLVVQCGAPVYWKNAHSHCGQTEWFKPLIERRWQTVRTRVPLLNLGAGACQALSSDGKEVSGDERCRAFIQKFSQWSKLTTVRDSLAQQILQQCGYRFPLLPCPSVFAPHSAGISVESGGYVALNYMQAGGHYDLGNLGAASSQAWERRFVKMADELAKTHDCRIVCHEQKELEAVRRLLPNMTSYLASTWREALAMYAGCQFAIVNRVHGAVVAAAMGKPVLLTGNDSRVLTADVVPGICILPVTAAQEEFDQAVHEVRNASANVQIGVFLQETEGAYLKLLRSALIP